MRARGPFQRVTFTAPGASGSLTIPIMTPARPSRAVQASGRPYSAGSEVCNSLSSATIIVLDLPVIDGPAHHGDRHA
jgi:hypothetical protein